MNQIDCKQAQRVWSRVMAAQTDAQEANAKTAVQTAQPTAQTAPEISITPEQIMEQINGELSDAATYRALSNRMNGCAKKTLEELSRDEKCHAKKLAAMYFDWQKGLPEAAGAELHHLQRRNASQAVSKGACRARPI